MTEVLQGCTSVLEMEFQLDALWSRRGRTMVSQKKGLATHPTEKNGTMCGKAHAS